VKSSGQRVVKHRHVMDEALDLDAAELAIVGVLLLRGAQTPGELKGRTERWHRFRSLDDVEEVLQRLGQRGFTEALARRPGQKEVRWVQRLAPVASGTEAPAPVATVPAPEAAAVEERTEPTGERREREREREPAEAHSLDVRNPATGEVIRTVAITEPGEIRQKLDRARRAQQAWAARRYEERAATLRAARDLLAEEAGECAALTSGEMGKPVRQARGEVLAALERIDWNVEHVGPVIAPRTVTSTGAVEERVTCEPIGVVAHISAWNYPYFVALNTIVPALLTGNAVLYKPSEHATLTGLRLVDILHRSGVPVDVVQTVVGAGRTGATLVDSDIDMVCFTGSYGTGRQVLRSTADRMVRVQLELGGKDAAYVCDDVDVAAAAVDVAEGAFYNCGQSCAATERVYVHTDVWDKFLDAFVDVVQAYRVGDPTEDTTDVGPLARPAQLEVLDAQIADAVQRGARVLCGGERIDRAGNWFAPTVLVDVDDRMSVMRDESFGPIIGLQRVRDDDDAVARMDDTDYGLGAAVFSRDRGRAERILGRLDVGNAYWNTADRSCVRLPWAGRRHSGLGVSMSESGIRTFVREKAWHLVGQSE
jgi:acyl-CoA reductase-like NAD-dependent aldehyde dehydrogenase